MQGVFSAAEDDDGLFPVEKGIADSTVADTLSFQLTEPRDGKTLTGRTSRQDNAARFDFLRRRFHDKMSQRIIHADPDDFRFLEKDAEAPCPGYPPAGQLSSADRFGKSVIIFKELTSVISTSY